MTNANTQNVSPVSQTPDELLKQQLKQQLQQLIPQAFSEGKLDVDTLRGLLGDDVLAPMQEAYGLNWAGKHHVYRELKTPTSQTLLPEPDESVDFDTTDNLFIEGDNLAVLKVLQKSYYNRIKMIYIDPPYNTGNDRFIYPDDYSESLAEYQARAGQLDDDGNLTYSDGMRSNRKENGQYHSNWLNMMYPRLALAKNLLRDDGVIFVSIDDNEVANLRLLMDEIFGEENFVANVVWKHTEQNKNDEKYFSRQFNYLLVYRKSEQLENFRFPRTEKDNRNYSNPDNDPNGMWRSGDVRSPNYRQTLCFNIETPSGNVILSPENGWRWSKESIKEKIKTGEIIFDETESRIIRKIYLANQDGRVPENLWQGELSGTTRIANKELKLLFDEAYFDTPKPTNLIRRIMELFHKEDSDYIILDFFAGSSTTAHAVMALNAEDTKNSEDNQNKNTAGKRKFIMVQIPEAIDPEDNKNAYEFCQNNNLPPTIAEISKERIRRAGQQILKDNPDLKDSNLDIGFKAYKIVDSNFIPWQQPETRDANSLLALLEKHVNPLVDNATDSGLVTELMLKEGYTLTADIEEMDGFYLVNQPVGHEMSTEATLIKADTMTLAIVLEDMSKDKTAQLIALKPSKTIILDNAFSDDDNKANTLLQFEDAGLVVGCV